MFDIGWTEMLVIAVVMIVVVGPKDLPKMLRTFGKTTAKMRAMAGDFQKQFNEALKEAELEDVKKSVDALKSLNPANEIRKQLNPFEKAAADVRSGLDTLKQPAKPADPAPAVATAAEPLKSGATQMPGTTADAKPTTAGPATPVSGPAPALMTAKPVDAAKPVVPVEPAKPTAVVPPVPEAAKQAGKPAPKPRAKASTEAKPAAPKAAAAKAAAPKPAASRKKPAGNAP